MSVNTLRKIVTRATADGWLYAESRTGSVESNSHRIFRLTVPDFVVLSPNDQKLADLVVSARGALPSVSLRVTQSEPTECVIHGDTVSQSAANGSEPVRRKHSTPASVSNASADCVTEPAQVCHLDPPSVSLRVTPKSYRSSLEEVSREEGRSASAATDWDGWKFAEAKSSWTKKGTSVQVSQDEITAKILKLRSAKQEAGDIVKQLKQYGVTVDRVEKVLREGGRA